MEIKKTNTSKNNEQELYEVYQSQPTIVWQYYSGMDNISKTFIKDLSMDDYNHIDPFKTPTDLSMLNLQQLARHNIDIQISTHYNEHEAKNCLEMLLQLISREYNFYLYMENQYLKKIKTKLKTPLLEKMFHQETILEQKIINSVKNYQTYLEKENKKKEYEQQIKKLENELKNIDNKPSYFYTYGSGGRTEGQLYKYDIYPETEKNANKVIEENIKQKKKEISDKIEQIKNNIETIENEIEFLANNADQAEGSEINQTSQQKFEKVISTNYAKLKELQKSIKQRVSSINQYLGTSLDIDETKRNIYNIYTTL